MPAGFDRCVRRGGKVRTKKVSGNKFMPICFIGDKSFVGKVRIKKKVTRKIKKTRGEEYAEDGQ